MLIFVVGYFLCDGISTRRTRRRNDMKCLVLSSLRRSRSNFFSRSVESGVWVRQGSREDPSGTTRFPRTSRKRRKDSVCHWTIIAIKHEGLISFDGLIVGHLGSFLHAPHFHLKKLMPSFIRVYSCIPSALSIFREIPQLPQRLSVLKYASSFFPSSHEIEGARSLENADVFFVAGAHLR